LGTDILLQRKVKLKDKVFVTGFHGVGYVGFLAIQHLVKALNAEKIGFILTDSLPPLVRMDDNSLVAPYELYSSGRFIFLLTNVPLAQDAMRPFCENVAEWVSENGLREAILIGGLDVNTKKEGDESLLRIAATRRYIAANVPKDPMLESELYIVGPLAYLLLFFEILDFPAIAVLPYAHTNLPDPRAASVAVRYFAERYGLDVNISELMKKAEEFEKQLKQIEHLEEKIEKIRGAGGPGTYYI